MCSAARCLVRTALLSAPCSVRALQFGQVTAVVIPRPPPAGQAPPPGVGKVIVEFTDVNGAMAAQKVRPQA